MENFFYEDRFYGDLSSLVHDLEEDEDKDIEDFPEDYTVEVYEGIERKIHQFKPEEIVDLLPDDVWDEDFELVPRVIEVLIKHIDFEKLNADMPTLFFESRNKVVLKKKDLI